MLEALKDPETVDETMLSQLSELMSKTDHFDSIHYNDVENEVQQRIFQSVWLLCSI